MMVTDKDRETARMLWDEIDQFGANLLGEGPFSVFDIARKTEPTKTYLEKERAFAIGGIATKLAESAQQARKEAADRAVQFSRDDCGGCSGFEDCTAQDCPHIANLRAAILGEEK